MFPRTEIKNLLDYRELLLNLVIRNLKIRYKSSTLGFLWSLLNPVFLILIYYFFIRLMRFQMNLADLLSGVIPWHFFAMTVNDSVEAISSNSTLITKVRFPRVILPLSTVLADLVNYVLSLSVLFLFLPLLGCVPTAKILLLVPVIFLTLLFVMGLGFLVSTANVYFKDTPHLLNILLMAWFFMTPIIYPLSQLPERFRELVFLNPMAGIISLYRFCFLGTDFSFSLWKGFSLIFVLFTFLIGVKVFYHFEPVFADEL